MNRNVLTGMALVSALGAILSLSRTSGFQGTAIPPRTTFPITLGERATSAESWDGRAEVSPGAIAGLEGWHFLTGQTASGSSWRASVRVDEVAPFSDPHYTELRGGEKPAPLYFPVGVYLTLEAPPQAPGRIPTALGGFPFPARPLSPDP